MNTQQTTIKTAFEIGSLVGQLNPKNQSYVLNTINALLFSQQTNEKEDNKNSDEKTA
ncbi:TPA: hypothetical protein ACXC99_003705 [Clostridium botulinum]|uniref:hypothetical protein n=1 Tax=Clostridium botulinum TaxID=1491 RepID=UPI001C9B86FC|nr:hypothetical protein [Clostridium botulinum]MBY6798152.1 hypothetical protein [Clostridium botulinum]MBY6867874.1 hypothetical protein [Clostridium botulinum]